MKLVYNVKVWDWEWSDCVLNGEYDTCEASFPNRRSNAGLGWRLTLGRLLPPDLSGIEDHRVPLRTAWIYESPAGDEHEFSGAGDTSIAFSAGSA